MSFSQACGREDCNCGLVENDPCTCGFIAYEQRKMEPPKYCLRTCQTSSIHCHSPHCFPYTLRAYESQSSVHRPRFMLSPAVSGSKNVSCGGGSERQFLGSVPMMCRFCSSTSPTTKTQILSQKKITFEVKKDTNDPSLRIKQLVVKRQVISPSTTKKTAATKTTANQMELKCEVCDSFQKDGTDERSIKTNLIVDQTKSESEIVYGRTSLYTIQAQKPLEENSAKPEPSEKEMVHVNVNKPPQPQFEFNEEELNEVTYNRPVLPPEQTVHECKAPCTDPSSCSNQVTLSTQGEECLCQEGLSIEASVFNKCLCAPIGASKSTCFCSKTPSKGCREDSSRIPIVMEEDDNIKKDTGTITADIPLSCAQTQSEGSQAREPEKPSPQNLITVAKIGLKLRLDKNDDSKDYVIIDSPVCMPKYILENNCTPILFPSITSKGAVCGNK